MFEQRYGLINRCNWLTTVKPQLESPVYEICDGYEPIEARYKEWLKSVERTDIIIALSRKSEKY